MNKIPVGHTLAQAYGFAFGNFITLVKLCWLPLVVALGASFAVMPMLAGVFQAAAGQPMAAATPSFLLIGLLYLVAMVAILVQFVAIAQYPLGINPNPGWINFPLGLNVLRMIGAWILVLLIMIGVGLALGLVVGLAASAIGATSGKPAVAGLALAASMLLTYAVIIYLLVRLTFLLTPVVVAENRIGLGRSWSLGKGNFWRMFAILICVFLPFIVVEIVAILSFAPGFPGAPAGASPAQAQAAIMAWEGALMARMSGAWYVFPIFGVFCLLLYGLLIGAQCFAYRALVPAESTADAFS